MSENLITAEWLAEVGFKWHQLSRQPDRHWLLWLGDALIEADSKGKRRMFASNEDLGIELAPGAMGDLWFCWLRADTSHRYSRFLHVRHLRYQSELIRMIEGLTGQAWNPANNYYGSMRTPEHAEHLRKEAERLDKQLVKDIPWRKAIETDEAMGGPLPEHLEAYVENELHKK